jgi:F-type H+-transporting ATPase subunit alpha
LEAFSKFGSDLDAATMAVLDKGRKNVQLLKQAQYQPMPVANQVALIYCGTRGLLRDVPLDKMAEFEHDFIENLELRHSKVLEDIGDGKMDDDIEVLLREVAEDLSLRYRANEES